MCTQKPPYDYSEQLYNRYKDAFTRYIVEKVFLDLRASEQSEMSSLNEGISCKIQAMITGQPLANFVRGPSVEPFFIIVVLLASGGHYGCGYFLLWKHACMPYSAEAGYLSPLFYHIKSFQRGLQMLVPSSTASPRNAPQRS